jgi:hypothetical protein
LVKRRNKIKIFNSKLKTKSSKEQKWKLIYTRKKLQKDNWKTMEDKQVRGILREKR